MKKKLFIRAESGSKIGLGHVIRSMALAEMLRDDLEIIFLLNTQNNNVRDVIQNYADNIILLPEANLNQEIVELKRYINSNDILLLDGYSFKDTYQKKIKQEINCKLVAIDDLHDFHQYADAVINHAVGGIEEKYSKEPYTKLFCGLEYALVREEFRNVKSTGEKQKGTLLIAMGGADPGNFSGQLLKSLQSISDINTINILIGKLNPNKTSLEQIKKEVISKGKQINLIDHLTPAELIRYYLNSESVILSASGMTIEALSVGIKPGVIQTADNQKDFFNYLTSHKMVTDCSGLLIGELKENEGIYQELRSAMKSEGFIGKNSAQRIKKIFSEL